MILKECDGVRWLQFELLADAPVIHGCFTRHGGCSSGNLASLNVGRSVGDLPENVSANYAKICRVLGIEELVAPRLSHGAEIEAVTRCREVIPLADGVMTDRPLLGLSISQADCQAAILYDPVNHALANVHCGWRGSVLNIYKAAVERMCAAYGSDPADIIACISPSLGPESSEFVNYRTELPESFIEYRHRTHHFDFWAISERQLLDAGLLRHHIEIARVDTFREEDYFSYRRNKLCGRQATVCALLVNKPFEVGP